MIKGSDKTADVRHAAYCDWVPGVWGAFFKIPFGFGRDAERGRTVRSWTIDIKDDKQKVVDEICKVQVERTELIAK